jgi:hypothetical protein
VLKIKPPVCPVFGGRELEVTDTLGEEGEAHKDEERAGDVLDLQGLRRPVRPFANNTPSRGPAGTVRQAHLIYESWRGVCPLH